MPTELNIFDSERKEHEEKLFNNLSNLRAELNDNEKELSEALNVDFEYELKAGRKIFLSLVNSEGEYKLPLNIIIAGLSNHCLELEKKAITIIYSQHCKV